MTFLSDTGETFTLQLDGVDTEVNEQLDTRVGLQRERVVGLEDFADGAARVLHPVAHVEQQGA